MITAKFGGTAITPTNLHFVKSCLTSSHNAVVVSAVGKEHPQDVKATDLLKQFYLTHNEAYWTAFCAKYRRLVEVNSVNVDVDKLLQEALLRATKYNLDYCMSLGEELSAKIVAKYLSAAYVEAEQIVRFGKRRLLLNATLQNIANAFKGVDLAVMGGFYGGCVCSRQVFSRGGSDITGSLCAVALGANLYENWTDSYGVCVANPIKIFDVSTVSGLSYDEMFALAAAGAEVLHPDAVKPCKTHGVPIKIGNFYNPYGRSTLISNCPSRKKILSIAERIDSDGNMVTTILHNLAQHEAIGVFASFLQDNFTVCRVFDSVYSSERVAVDSFTCQGNVVTVTTNRSVIVELYKHLKAAGLIE